MASKRLRAIGCGLVLALVAIAAGWPPPAVAASSPNDPLFKRQWGLRRIGAPAAWATTTGKGITVAVLDTGVERIHEDLRANMAKAQKDFIDNDNTATPVTQVGPFASHGTNASGVIAAVRNNRRGIAGVAPSAKIMAARVGSGLDQRFNPDAATEAITWAVENGADVINMSLGAAVLFGNLILPLPMPAMDAAVLEATASGTLIVASAGNSASPFCAEPGANPAVICVGASNEVDGIADFSNYAVRLDVVAPGTSILTTGLLLSPYEPVDGTSFSAPFVSGLGALLMSMGATNVLAANIIKVTAKDLGLPGYDITYGFGRIDAKAAVDLCKQIC